MSLCTIIAALHDVFEKYAGKEGDSNTLTKAELCKLLKTEYILPPQENADVDKFFGMLDADKDGVVNFQEFVTFVGALATLCKKCT